MNSKKGFTLLETLVSMVIISLITLSAFQTINQVNSLNTTTNDIAILNIVNANVMEDVEKIVQDDAFDYHYEFENEIGKYKVTSSVFIELANDIKGCEEMYLINVESTIGGAYYRKATLRALMSKNNSKISFNEVAL